MDQVNFFRGCLPQILLGPFLNTFSQIIQIYMKKQLEKPFRDFPSPLEEENLAPQVTANQICRQLHDKPCDYWLIISLFQSRYSLKASLFTKSVIKDPKVLP